MKAEKEFKITLTMTEEERALAVEAMESYLIYCAAVLARNLDEESQRVTKRHGAIAKMLREALE